MVFISVIRSFAFSQFIMRIYKCIFTDTEVFCDNDRALKLVDDVVYEMEGRMVEIGGEDYGISANVDEDAAEGATAEDGENKKQKVCDVVHFNRLMETSYDKKGFMGYLKNYMKKVNDTLKETKGEEESKKFMTGAQTFAKKVIGEFDEFQFFLPPLHDDADPDESIIVLSKWDGEIPKFYFWAHGLKSEKV
jgi:flagellar hook-basal body complex protein FliE